MDNLKQARERLPCVVRDHVSLVEGDVGDASLGNRLLTAISDDWPSYFNRKTWGHNTRSLADPRELPAGSYITFTDTHTGIRNHHPLDWHETSNGSVEQMYESYFQRIVGYRYRVFQTPAEGAFRGA